MFRLIFLCEPSYSSINCSKDYLCSIVLPFLLCQRPDDYIYVCLFLVSLFCYFSLLWEFSRLIIFLTNVVLMGKKLQCFLLYIKGLVSSYNSNKKPMGVHSNSLGGCWDMRKPIHQGKTTSNLWYSLTVFVLFLLFPFPTFFLLQSRNGPWHDFLIVLMPFASQGPLLTSYFFFLPSTEISRPFLLPLETCILYRGDANKWKGSMYMQTSLVLCPGLLQSLASILGALLTVCFSFP